MKKIIVILVVNLISLCLFAGNYEDSKKFDVDSVLNFNISLLKENLTVSTSKGNEIYVISETNDKSMIPIVELENKTINIKNADYPFDKKSTCHISLLLPENYAADKVAIETAFGKLAIKKLTANFVSLNPGPDNSLANIKADYFEIPIPDEADMNISNLDSKEIKISLLAGSVNLSLLRIPERESRISSKFGNLNISFPKDESYTINARSFYSKFINNLNGSVTDWIREGKTYKHNGGGVEIMLQTHNGDIEIRE